MNQQSEESKKDGHKQPRVTGVGGVFFYVENLKETSEWYIKNLGIDINNWGFCSFTGEQNQNAPLQWKPFKKESNHFAPSGKEFMINYTVQNLEALAIQLRANGVTILDEIESYDFGKFLHILDPEGHKIELWEPA